MAERRRWAVPQPAITAVVVLALALLVFCLWLVVTSPTPAASLLEFLRMIVVSWPVAATVLVLAAGYAFGAQLAVLIERSSKWGLKAPGGFEATLEQQVAKGERDHQELLLQQAQSLLDEQQKRLTEKEQEATYWRFEYADASLVPNTKFVLSWFAQQQRPVTRAEFDVIWGTGIPNPLEREAILAALVQLGLLATNGVSFWITDLGRSFLAYFQGKYPPARPLPPTPAASPESPPGPPGPRPAVPPAYHRPGNSTHAVPPPAESAADRQDG